MLKGYDQYLPCIANNSRTPEAFFVYFLYLLLAYISLLKKSEIGQYPFLISLSRNSLSIMHKPLEDASYLFVVVESWSSLSSQTVSGRAQILWCDEPKKRPGSHKGSFGRSWHGDDHSLVLGTSSSAPRDRAKVM